MSAELTVIYHLLATLRQIRRTQPDMAIATAALEEEKRLTERVQALSSNQEAAA